VLAVRIATPTRSSVLRRAVLPRRVLSFVWSQRIKGLRALPFPLPPVSSPSAPPSRFRFVRRRWRPARQRAPHIPFDLPASTRTGWPLRTNSAIGLCSLPIGERQWSERVLPPVAISRSSPAVVFAPPIRWARTKRYSSRPSPRPRPLSLGPVRLLFSPRARHLRRLRIGRLAIPTLRAVESTLPYAFKLALTLWALRRRGRRWPLYIKRAYAVSLRSPTLKRTSSPATISLASSRYPDLSLYRHRFRGRVVRLLPSQPPISIGGFRTRTSPYLRRRRRRPYLPRPVRQQSSPRSLNSPYNASTR